MGRAVANYLRERIQYMKEESVFRSPVIIQAALDIRGNMVAKIIDTIQGTDEEDKKNETRAQIHHLRN